VDVLNTPGGREALFEKYGMRKVPVLAKDDDFVFGQMLDPFAKFVGIDPNTIPRLSPEQLFRKQQTVFAAAQRLLRQFPNEALQEKVIPNRPRVLATMGYHIFRIGEAFLETWDGAEYSVKIADNEPPAEMKTFEDIARFGESISKRYQDWWAKLTPQDKALPRMLKTYYGDTQAHRVYERITWHSAQHARQLAAVLERMGITPDRPLTAEELAGLPLPERLWE
jgi:hypothetical protein